MTRVLLYWNHICVLHKQEKIFLERLAGRLKAEGIVLETRYFGLGYPEHLSEYLARADAVLPDIIVSSDLEVFEDTRIFKKLENNLYPAAEWIPQRQGPALEAVRRGAKLLPFLSIPLVYYTADTGHGAGKRLPEIEDLAFGGINNSAGKTLVKAVWSRYGREAALRLLKGEPASDMPVGAFQRVRLGQSTTALVPSIYALRADQESFFLCRPEEGPLLIPSYFCARGSIPETAARRVAEEILCPELCDFYVENGDLIVYPTCAAGRSRQEGERYFTPAADWYGTVSPEEFYALYGSMLPTARVPFKA